MDSSLHEVWEAAAGTPFVPTVGKGIQFLVGFTLVLSGLAATGIFALNRSLVNLAVIGIPASPRLRSEPSTCSARSESTSEIPSPPPAADLVYASWKTKKHLVAQELTCLAVCCHLLFAPSRRPSQCAQLPDMAPEDPPIFRAVATSTRPLYQLLRCVNFAPRAHVQITEEGIRFAADHARVMQGVAFLDRALFSAYTVNLPPPQADDEPPELPNFQIPLASLLEVLQIFGAVDVATRAQKADQDLYRSNLRNYRPDAFSNQTLGISGTCTLVYAEEGDPFKITIEESGVKTTAGLTTYVPEIPEDIPFDRADLSFKIIMQSRTLLDALAEISPTAPEKLTITAMKTSPYLSLSGTSDLGSSGVDFARRRDLLETFTIAGRWSQTYRFDFIKSSTEAMRIATKVSLRGDGQGVLSLQFMVDMEGGKRSFLDFRFVQFMTHDDDDDVEGEEES